MSGDQVWDLIKWGFIPAVTGMLWLSWQALTRAARVKDDLADFKVKVAEKYATNSYIQEVEKRLTEILRRIEDRLNRDNGAD
jgi:hypothetical protein